MEPDRMRHLIGWQQPTAAHHRGKLGRTGCWGGVVVDPGQIRAIYVFINARRGVHRQPSNRMTIVRLHRAASPNRRQGERT